MQRIKVKRTGQGPIAFTGDLIGYGTTRDDLCTWWTTVYIWKSIGGRYVVGVKNGSQAEGERGHERAAVIDTASGVIDWLREDNAKGDGCVGHASEAAIEAACEVDAMFTAAWVEEID